MLACDCSTTHTSYIFTQLPSGLLLCFLQFVLHALLWHTSIKPPAAMHHIQHTFRIHMGVYDSRNSLIAIPIIHNNDIGLIVASRIRSRLVASCLNDNFRALHSSFTLHNPMQSVSQFRCMSRTDSSQTYIQTPECNSNVHSRCSV